MFSTGKKQVVVVYRFQHLRADLSSLLWVDGADVFVVFQCVLPVLLFCTDILLQQAQHLSGLSVTPVNKHVHVSCQFLFLRAQTETLHSDEVSFKKAFTFPETFTHIITLQPQTSVHLIGIL